MSIGQTGVLKFPSRIWAPLLATIGLTFSAAANAALQDVEAANNQVSAQFQYSYVHYAEKLNDNETGNGGTLDSEDGYVTGYALSSSAMKDLWLGHDYFGAQYSSLSGKTNYIGGTQANPTYGSLTGESGARAKDGSLRYGAGIVIDHDLMVTPYGEFGYHKYVRTLVYGSPASYQETYTHKYFGAGAWVQYSPSDKWVYSFNALIGRTYGANVAVALPSPFTGFTASLGNSILENIGFSVDYAFAKRVHLKAGAEVVGWSYGSGANRPIGNGLYAYEPNSMTCITTAKVGVGFGF